MIAISLSKSRVRRVPGSSRSWCGVLVAKAGPIALPLATRLGGRPRTSRYCRRRWQRVVLLRTVRVATMALASPFVSFPYSYTTSILLQHHLSITIYPSYAVPLHTASYLRSVSQNCIRSPHAVHTPTLSIVHTTQNLRSRFCSVLSPFFSPSMLCASGPHMLCPTTSSRGAPQTAHPPKSRLRPLAPYAVAIVHTPLRFCVSHVLLSPIITDTNVDISHRSDEHVPRRIPVRLVCPLRLRSPAHVRRQT